VPSPVAHSLAGLAIAGLARHTRVRREGRREPFAAAESARGPLLTLALMGAAVAPDFDFFPGLLVGYADWLHRGVSHSFVAAVSFGVLIGLIARRARLGQPARLGSLMAAAYASHLVLDLFSPGEARFIGMPLFWPLSTDLFLMPTSVFLDIRRDPAADDFFASLWQMHNLHAMFRECLIMAPLLIAGGLMIRVFRTLRITPPLVASSRLDRRADSKS
jgi:membrane-bound metal-dependent hydrolase YbcI (DUF457 family)